MQSATGQENKSDVESESLGYSAFELILDGEPDAEPIEYFVSSGGRVLDTTTKRPIVVYLQGSGSTPLFYGEPTRLSSSLMFGPDDFPNHHYVVIGKPGVPFYSKDKDYQSDEYDRRLSLPHRVAATNQVLAQVLKQAWARSDQVVVVGHSEGADVAPRVAAGNPSVTHLAVFAPGALSQMFEFVIQQRKQIAGGKITPAEGDAAIEQLYQDYAKILANPNATDESWNGHTYLRWSTFFEPASESYAGVDVPVFAAVCREDANTPLESGEAIRLEFLRLGKPNLTYKVWPTDHYFLEYVSDTETIDRRMDAFQEFMGWLKKNSSLENVELPELQAALATRVEQDQQARFQMIEAMKPKADGSVEIPSDLLQAVRKIDQENTAWLKAQVDEHRWLGKSLVGVEGAHNAWLIVQHADEDRAFQRRCLELMNDIGGNEVSAIDLAYLTDRILSAEGKPQRFGTQTTVVDGEYTPGDVEDPENLDQRRAELGLPSMADYLEQVKAMYGDG
jgi:pimeloyl-ACP methyl ester carboxylesterase